MPVNLKVIPPAAWRPEPIRFSYWFSTLGVFITLGAFTGLVLDRQGETKYWLLLSVTMALAWLVVFVLRLLFWLFQHNHADGWDRRREETLLRETRRGRRALQILHAGLVIPLPEDSTVMPLPLLMNGPSALRSQPGRSLQGEYCFHTFFPLTEEMKNAEESPDAERHHIEVFRTHCQKLIDDVAVVLEIFSPEQPLALLFDVDTSIPLSEFKTIFTDALKIAGITQPVKYLEGRGMGVIDEWLDLRINDKTLLLVFSGQVAPLIREGSTEALVTLLLGNRLTQNAVRPMAWLHRPERTVPDSPAEGIAQAAYWVPLEEGQLKELWLSGLNAQETSAIIPALAHPLLSGVPSPAGRHNTDLIIGNAGCVSPWLAAAAATLSAQQTSSAQLAISADRDTGTLWTQAITPA